MQDDRGVAVMKHYNPKAMKPDSAQFSSFVKDQISDEGKQSLAFKLVRDLYQVAQGMYRSLDGMTSESLAIFNDTDEYLTATQEHDLMAMTAIYVGNLRTQSIHEAVEQDEKITDAERAVLKSALENFRSSAESVYATLGNPRWLEKA